MEKSCHYYAVLALGLMSGLKPETARTVAYASQYVDDAKINKITFKDRYGDPLFIDHKVKGRRPVSIAHNIATCHSYFKIETFNWQSMTGNTSVFHFFPAGEGETFTEKMLCHHDPAVLRSLVAAAAARKTLDPVRLGMLLHVYADTFAHRGFSGILCLENDVKYLQTEAGRNLLRHLGRRLKRFVLHLMNRLFKYVLPAYGHAKALTYPDIPFLEWSYIYDRTDTLKSPKKTGIIENPARYREAFTAIARVFGSIKDKNAFTNKAVFLSGDAWNDFFAVMFKNESMPSKIRRWRRFIKKLDAPSAGAYDDREWLRGAFLDFDKRLAGKRVIRGVRLVEGYKKTPWFQFIRSVDWYKTVIFKRLAAGRVTIPR
ncbi:MAG: hypothetical protein JXD23_03485 [Spirochaetales bacterium]|nr:hypothetical protein [Spirochaetales bacterium]